jgi:hypothetical protein
VKSYSLFFVFGSALGLSTLAAIISIIGMTALFPGDGIIIAIMMAILEASKLVAAAWLHANWRNAAVSVLHKLYLGLAILALMLITAIGVYGYLAKGYLEQQTPLASVQLHIDQKTQQIETDNNNIKRLTERQAQLDAAVNALITQNQVARSQTIRNQQRKEREQIAADLKTTQQDIVKLTDELVPLRMATNTVHTKLGPVKYVADLFGWTDPDSAVRMVILVLMFAFDPLAIVLILSGSISMSGGAKKTEAVIARSNHAPRKISRVLETNPSVTVKRMETEDSDKLTILEILRRNPAIIEDIIDSVIELHGKDIR